jgi:hypothetical protein
MSKITDYPGAVERIWDAHGEVDAIFEQDVVDALKESQHVNGRTAREIAQNGVATIESVQAALEGAGELPDAVDLASTIQDQTMVDDGSRGQQMAADLADAFVMQSDIQEAVGEIEGRDGMVFRQDVEAAMDEETSGKQWVGADESQTVSDVAQQLGTPDRETFEREATQAMIANQRDASDYEGYDGSGEMVSVIESMDGEIIGVSGGSKGATQAVAEAEGAKAISGSPTDTFELERSSGKSTLTLDGKPVRDIDV